MVRLCMSDTDDGCGDDARAAAPATWFTYRRSVRARLRETIAHAFERLAARLGPETFCELQSAFFHARGPRGVILRHVPQEFLAFLVDHVRECQVPDLPPWTIDLARFEWAELEVAYAADEDPWRPAGPLSMERPLALSDACRILRLEHRVHDLSREHPSESLRAEGVTICLYRDRETFDARVLELSESAAILLESAGSQGRTLTESAKLAASHTGAAFDATWLGAFAALVADLTERGVVIGSCPAVKEKRWTSE
jgi:hypothetical protein